LLDSMVRRRAAQSEEAAETTPSETNEEINIGDEEAVDAAADEVNGEESNADNAKNGDAAADTNEPEGDFLADESAQVNGVNDKSETKETSKPNDHASNDSACVLQELSYRRVTIPMLAKHIFLEKTGEILTKYASIYNIHVPRISKNEENKELFAIIDCECASSENADKLIAEMNEALAGKAYTGSNEYVARKWPDTKQFYNDYENMKELSDAIKSRFKEGMLTAGAHKLETHWIALRNVPSEMTVEEAIEQSEEAVDGFKTIKGDRIYMRCDSRDVTFRLHNKKIKKDEKNYVIKPLSPHPSLKGRGFQGSNQGNRSQGNFNNSRGNNNFNYGYRGGYMGNNQGNYQPGPNYGGSWGPQQYGGPYGGYAPQQYGGPGPAFDNNFRRNPPQGGFNNNSKRVRY